MNKQENIKNLMQLINENPELPIIPLVDWEVVGDDHGCWLGEWGGSHIVKYCLYDKGDMVKVIYWDTDFYEMACGMGIDDLPDDVIKEIINKQKWIEAIAVNIDVP